MYVLKIVQSYNYIAKKPVSNKKIYTLLIYEKFVCKTTTTTTTTTKKMQISKYLKCKFSKKQYLQPKPL